MSYSSSATIARLLKEERLTALSSEPTKIAAKISDHPLVNLFGVWHTDIRLPAQNNDHHSVYCSPTIYRFADKSYLALGRCNYGGYLKIGELVEGEPKIVLTDNAQELLKLWAEVFPSAPYKLLKERKGVVQDKNFLRWWYEILHAVFTRDNNNFALGNLTFHEGSLKEWLEMRKPVKGYVYQVNTAEMSCDDMELVIKEIYSVHKRTNTSSCMVKGSIDAARGAGMNYYKGVLHPFHSYRAENWCLLLVSEHAPDVVFNWLKDETPFRLRAWGYTEQRFIYNGTGELLRSEPELTFARAYGDGLFEAVLKARLKEKSSLYGAEIRCYNDCGIYSAPYVDGNMQTVYIDYKSHTDNDGMEYVIGEIHEEDWSSSDMYKPNHSTGTLEEVERWHECEVDGEDYQEHEMVWVDELDGYVHERFWDYNNDALDGLAILQYFNRQ